jgi:hypothetical protein
MVRADTEAPVRLWGPHLYWASHRVDGSGNPSQSGSDQEFAALDTYLLPAPGTNTWGIRMMTFFVHTNHAGAVNTSGTQTSAGHAIWVAHVDGLVSRASANNAYIMFSWAFDDPTGTHNKVIDANGRATLRYLARRFTGNPAVLFACQAEPPNAANGGTNTWSTLKAACELTIDQIRAEYATVPIGIPGLSWSQDVAQFPGNPVARSNIFVKPHMYWGRLEPAPATPRPMTETIVASGAQACFDAGYPIIVGECGWGNRSNETDLNELFNHCETNNWGWQGWALRNLTNGTSGSPRFADGPTLSSQLTSWGALARDESQYWYTLSPPSGSGDPNDPPDIGIPASAEEIVNNATVNWTDGSFGATVTVGSAWQKVVFTAAGAGYQMQVPSEGSFPISQFDDIILLVHATDAQLNGMRLRIYQEHLVGASSVLSGSLTSYVSGDLGNEWRSVIIPLSDFDFSFFGEQIISRIELENNSGASMSAYYVAEWALRLSSAIVVSGISITTEPSTSSPAAAAIIGPPTVRILDASSAAIEGAVVTATLNGGLFSTQSVTVKETNWNGYAIFDFLLIAQESTIGYSITFTASTSFTT